MPVGHVLMVCGPAGSGKTVLARELARMLPAALLDGDAVHGPLMPLLAGAGVADRRRALCDGLLLGAVEAASAGMDAVAVAPFTRELHGGPEWERAVELVRPTGSPPVIIWMHTPADALLERLTRRGAPRDADKLADPQRWLATVAPGRRPRVAHLEVDGARAVSDAVTELLPRLRERLRESAGSGLGGVEEGR